MKTILTTLLLSWMLLAAQPNAPVKNLDTKKFAGKWYSLYSTPTKYDKGSRQTTTTYTLTNDGYYKVKTEYKKGSANEIHNYTSKLFLNEDKGVGAMEAQFIWPFKADYWVIEVGKNYEYTVVGHPQHDYLFIMSRAPKMDNDLYDDIVARCKAKGYDVAKLTSQHHF